MARLGPDLADRLIAGPGSRVYGVPSAKLAWYASSRSAGRVPASVFWPVPNVESDLVAFDRREPPAGADRAATFAVIDAAFALNEGGGGRLDEQGRRVVLNIQAGE